MSLNIIEQEILELIKAVEDPEVGVNIVDLGLIYNIEINEDEGIISVEMTFTTPFCPYGASIQKQVEEVLEEIEGVNKVNLKIVFDPAWSRDMMNDEAKIQLGLL